MARENRGRALVWPLTPAKGELSRCRPGFFVVFMPPASVKKFENVAEQHSDGRMNGSVDGTLTRSAMFGCQRQ